MTIEFSDGVSIAAELVFPGRPDLQVIAEGGPLPWTFAEFRAAIQARDAREAEVRARSAVFPVDCIGTESAPHAPVCVGELGVTDSGEAYTSGRVTTYTPTERNTVESYSVTRLPACPTCDRGPTRVTDDSVLEILRETYRKRRKSVTVAQIDAVMARHAEGHTSP